MSTALLLSVPQISDKDSGSKALLEIAPSGHQWYYTLRYFWIGLTMQPRSLPFGPTFNSAAHHTVDVAVAVSHQLCVLFVSIQVMPSSPT